MKLNNKNFILFLAIGIIIGAIIKLAAPFSFLNIGMVKTFKIKNLNYSSSAYQGSGNSSLVGGACGN